VLTTTCALERSVLEIDAERGVACVLAIGRKGAWNCKGCFVLAIFRIDAERDKALNRAEAAFFLHVAHSPDQDPASVNIYPNPARGVTPLITGPSGLTI
jgi:hypothetical protein